MLPEGNADMAVDGEAGEGAEATVDGSEKEGESDDGAHRISKKRLRKEARLTVAELKQLVRKPDVVEVRVGRAQCVLLALRFFGPSCLAGRASVTLSGGGTGRQWVDVTAADPLLLVHLKSLRNTVPVPRHWGQKRKYLQNKRGQEKLPFMLPGRRLAAPRARLSSATATDHAPREGPGRSRRQISFARPALWRCARPFARRRRR